MENLVFCFPKGTLALRGANSGSEWASWGSTWNSFRISDLGVIPGWGVGGQQDTLRDSWGLPRAGEGTPAAIFGFSDRLGALDTPRFEDPGEATCWEPLRAGQVCARLPAAPPHLHSRGGGAGGRVRGRAGEVGCAVRIGARSCHSGRVGRFQKRPRSRQSPTRAGHCGAASVRMGRGGAAGAPPAAGGPRAGPGRAARGALRPPNFGACEREPRGAAGRDGGPRAPALPEPPFPGHLGAGARSAGGKGARPRGLE